MEGQSVSSLILCRPKRNKINNRGVAVHVLSFDYTRDPPKSELWVGQYEFACVLVVQKAL